MYLGRVFIAIFLFSILFLAGCSLSIEDASEKTVNAVEQSISEEKKTANQQSDEFHYYIPPQFTVDSETDNNVVFNHEQQTYILFINPFEPNDSDVVYQSTKENYINLEVDETFTKDGALGYVLIAASEDTDEEFYELTVGLGGVKMTTVTDTNNMENSAENMMEIVNSVEVLEGES